MSEVNGAEKLTLTPSMKKIMEVLSDGKAHSKEELFKCLGDDQRDMKTLAWHIFQLRERLAIIGEGVECGVLGHGRGLVRYRHVVLDQL